MAMKRPVKCPRCELNYVRPGETLCDVCMREGKNQDAQAGALLDICSECNENYVLPGEELCQSCLREKLRLEAVEKPQNDSPILESMDEVEDATIEGAEEIMIDNEADGIPADEMDEIEESFDDAEDDGADEDEVFDEALDNVSLGYL